MAEEGPRLVHMGAPHARFTSVTLCGIYLEEFRRGESFVHRISPEWRSAPEACGACLSIAQTRGYSSRWYDLLGRMRHWQARR